MWWCRTMHERISRPIHGQYRCWQCGRMHRCSWGDTIPDSPPALGQLQVERRAIM